MEESLPTCPRCGAAGDATALFCARCGHRMLGTSTPGTMRAGRGLIRFAHRVGGLLAVIARGVARLLLAFAGAVLAYLAVLVIGSVGGFGPGTALVAFLIGSVLFFVVLAWSGRLVLAPPFCPHCGRPLRAPTPAGETRRRLRSAASRMARVFAALVVAAFILTAVLFVVFSGRVEF